jgi:GntR family transcriptional repressor for pyruvate dehydrogenase complex
MAYSPVPIARESIITKAAEEIRRLITADGLRAGDSLPGEIELSRMLRISRNSVREALRILDGLGFVEKTPGKRVVVARGAARPTSQAVERSALLEAMPVAARVRQIVEECCAELAAAADDEVQIAELKSHLAAFEDARKRGDFPAAGEAHAAFHATLVEAARNPILASLFEQVSFVRSEMAREAQETLRDPRQLSLHAAILCAIHDRDGRRAAAAVRRHFRAVAPVIEFVTKHSRAAAQPGGGEEKHR